MALRYKKQKKYEVGDVVQLDHNWDNKLAIILEADDNYDDENIHMVCYYITVQGSGECGWINKFPIRGKIE